MIGSLYREGGTMGRDFLRTAVLCGAALGSAWGQAAPHDFPAAALTAKTMAIVNDTHDPKVTDGAVAALKSWGQFTVVDDPQVADITLRFDRTKERSGASTPQKTDSDGKPAGDPSYGYSFSMSSQIHMKAYLKDGDAAFFATKTDEGKVKAGMGCVNDLHTAFRTAKAAATP